MIDILKACPGDYEIIQNLAGKVWPQTYKKILSEEQVDYMFKMMYSHEAFIDQISIKGHHYLLAKEGNEYLGFASYELNYRSGAMKIHKLYVMPESQGKSIGRLLLSKMENIARKNGNGKIVLNVNRYNEAVHFYNKTGFVKAGQEDIDIGNGYLMEDYIMQKEI